MAMTKRHFAEKLPAALMLAAATLLLAACFEKEEVFDRTSIQTGEPTKSQALPVSEIIRQPGNYTNKEVRVFGKVVGGLAFEFVSEQPYLLEHGGKRLWVISRDIVPPQNHWVTVEGTIVSPYQLKGRHYELALLEKRRLE